MFHKYFLVSLVALALDTLLLHGLVKWAGVQLLVAAPLSFLAGSVFVYVCSSGLVFGQAQRRWGSEFRLFVAAGVLGLLINEVVLWTLVQAGSSLLLAKLGAAGCSFLSNYFCRKRIMTAPMHGALDAAGQPLSQLYVGKQEVVETR